MYAQVYELLLLTCLTQLIQAESVTKCKIIGLKCSEDKQKIEFCKEIEADPEMVETCEGNQMCTQEKDNIKCVDLNNIDIKFMCTGKGEFPDTKNCDKTYVCSGDGQEPSEVCTCTGGSYVYPAPGLFCMPGECPRENITCTEGAHGHFTLTNKQKTNYYYYCLSSDAVQVYDNVEVPTEQVIDELGTRLREMINGKECVPFKGNSPENTTPFTSTRVSETTAPTITSLPPRTQTTIDPSPSAATTQPTTQTTIGPSPSAATTQPTTQTTIGPSPSAATTEPTTQTTIGPSPSTATTEPTTPTTTAPPEEKPTCSRKGELHPAECDCDYYKCDSNLKPLRRICSDGLRFDPKLKKCIFGECKVSDCIHRPRNVPYLK